MYINKVNIELSIEDKRWNSLYISPKTIKRILRICIDYADNVILQGVIIKPQIKLNITLTNDINIQPINARYRNKNHPTDIISLSLPFFVESQFQLIGDIFLSYDTILQYTKENKVSLLDRIKHLLIHGILHLFSYNHKNEFGYLNMRHIEKLAARSLKISNSYIKLLI